MDVDLYKGCGLTGRARCMRNTQSPQFYEADHAGLRRLQPTEQIVERSGAYRGFPMIVDWSRTRSIHL
jgi:hypothetical protein